MRYVSTYYIHSLANCALLITILLCALFAGFSIYKKNDFFKELAKKVYLCGAITYVILTITYYAFTLPSMAVLMVIEDIIIILTVIIVAKKTKKERSL